MLLGNANHTARDDAQYLIEKKGNACDDDETRQLGMKEFLAVTDPFVEDFAQEPALLEDAPAHGQGKRQRSYMRKHAKTHDSSLDCAQEWLESGAAPNDFSG